MDPAAILALIADLYGQVQALARENAQLRQQIEGQQPTEQG